MLDAGKDQGRVAMTQWLKEGSVVLFIIQKTEESGRALVYQGSAVRNQVSDARRFSAASLCAE
jgi:hypothetical protein